MSTTPNPSPPAQRSWWATAPAEAYNFLWRGEGRIALPGLIGALLMVFGGFGSGALRQRDHLLEAMFLSWLRFGHGQILSGILVWAGVLLMIAAWVRLGRAALAGKITLKQMYWVVPLWTTPLLFSVPLFSRDAYSYLAQGALVRDGFNPYEVGPVVNPGLLLDNVSTVWTTTTTPYGPAHLLLTRGITMITGENVVSGTMLLRLTMLPGLALMVWAVPRIARHLGGNPTIALWLGVLNPLVLVHLIGGVHNEVLMVGLMAAGIVLVLERKHLPGIALIAVAVAVKATAGAALPFMVWIWMRHIRDDAELRGEEPPNWLRTFLKTAGAGAATFIAIFAAISLMAGVGLGWLTALSGSNKIINWLSLPTAVAQLYTLATSWFTHVQLAPVLQVTRLISAVTLVAIVIAVIIRYRNTVRQAMLGIVFAMIAIVLLSPAALPWYYSWPLAIGAGFALSTTTLAVLVGLCTWMMLIFQPDGSIGMYQWYHVLIATACAVVAAVSLTREDPLRLRRFLAAKPADTTADPTTAGPAPAPGPELVSDGPARDGV
ncbi:alpha-(1-_6)-mannopyranosyltransferase A [Tomitella biformata]|uniref:alpha-(1->6)-mannopyranosyltransferase A n=1 Tax=Tomitella biformata TaxID=630403 RepID=UPI000467802C|nr:alpha-(1->6)-mannopyranosyltransferase A [Tomitella biformata]